MLCHQGPFSSSGGTDDRHLTAKAFQSEMPAAMQIHLHPNKLYLDTSLLIKQCITHSVTASNFLVVYGCYFPLVALRSYAHMVGFMLFSCIMVAVGLKSAWEEAIGFSFV